jgi:hypothetical protein
MVLCRSLGQDISSYLGRQCGNSSKQAVEEKYPSVR